MLVQVILLIAVAIFFMVRLARSLAKRPGR
jgi:hypothetical protein